MTKLAGLILSIIFTFALFVPSVNAEIISSEKFAIVESDQIIDDDLFIGAETVRIEGTVNGDVYAGAGMLEVSGTINGDLITGAGNIEITGQIQDDVIAGGGNIFFRGAQIGDSVTIGGGNIDLDDQTTIGGGLLFGVGNIKNNAQVGRGILGGGGRVEINAPVGKNVRLGVGELYIGNNAQIAGDLWYSSEEKGSVDPEASISGKTTFKKYQTPEVDREQVRQGMQAAAFGFRIWSWLAASLVGSIIIWLLPKWSQKVVKQLQSDWGPNALAGFLYLILAIPVFIILLITVIGIPLAFIWITIFALAVYSSKMLIGYCLGEWLKTKLNWKTDNRYAVFLLGLLAWYLLRSLPFIGWLVGLATVIMGTGAMVMVMKKKNLK